MTANALPFDRVLLTENGEGRFVLVGEFMGIDLHDRMKIILEGRVEFFQGRERLPTLQALRAIYKLNQPAA
jgi:hypothetical protein